MMISPSGILLAGAAHDLEEVLLVRVHALVLQQPEQVQAAAVVLPAHCTSRSHARRLEQVAGAQPVVDALELLHHDAAGAHVQMADLAGALVAVGQPHGFAGAVQDGPGIRVL